MNNRIEQLLNEQARIEEELEEALADKDEAWPRPITMYLHSCKETNWDKVEHSGELDGMSDEAARTFSGTLYEVQFDLLVNHDGTYKILRVKDGSEILTA